MSWDKFLEDNASPEPETGGLIAAAILMIVAGIVILAPIIVSLNSAG